MEPATLCEQCGYQIDGLPAEAACPECGRPIADSSPRLRPGSPWQIRPGLVAWLKTAALAAIAPRRTARALRIDPPGRSWLLWINLALATLPMPTVMFTRVVWLWGGPFTLDALIVVAFAASLFAGLLALTAIEAMGIRFFGRQRRWRISPPVAWTICSHATFGWVIAGWLLALGYLATWQGWDREWLGDAGRIAWLASRRSLLLDLRALRPFVTGGLGFLIGLVVFETWVYLAVRQCRYANPPAGPAPRTPATPAA